MTYFFVDFYLPESHPTFAGGGMLTTYVEAPDAAAAIAAVVKAYPSSHSWSAYEIPDIPQDCPYLNHEGVLLRARADQPCDPPDACKNHGRCWTHSYDEEACHG